LWLALFVGVHFSICLTGMNPHSYEGTVGLVHRSLAYLPGAVLLLVLLPMLLQAGSGLYLAAKEGMQYDVKRCDRGGKLRYFLQRWSGMAMLAFLVLHVGSMHGWGLSFVSNGALNGSAFAYTAAKFHPWISPALDSITIILLLLGILGAVFHIANGAWSGGILWKLAQSERGKAWLGYICVGGGVVLAAMGTIAWYAFSLSPNVSATLAVTGR
jgi:succinate dehydrogenase / fumarate reductase cytochrome b subunit